MGLSQLLMETILVTGFLKSISGIFRKKKHYFDSLPFISVLNYVIRAKVNKIRAFLAQV